MIIYLFILCFLNLSSGSAETIFWPWSLSCEEIAPCSCKELYEPGHFGIQCINIIDINQIERVFSVEFPFNIFDEVMALYSFFTYD